MKRRNLLKMAGGSLALANFGLTPGAACASEPAFGWNRASAEGLVGQAFWLQHPQAGALQVTLASVSVPAMKSLDPRMEQFSLVFHGPLQPAVVAGTYELDHAALGRFDLYLAPGGRAGGNAVYRSDFSLLL